MIPIVCLGCNERAEIPFIPPDLTCVACKTGAHIDLDDSLEVTATAGETGDIECRKCGEHVTVPIKDGKYDIPLTCPKCDKRLWDKNSALDPTDPMMLLPSGVPDEDRDMPLLTEDEKHRKVVVPKGSAPYSQKALSSRLGPSQGGTTSSVGDAVTQTMRENNSKSDKAKDYGFKCSEFDENGSCIHSSHMQKADAGRYRSASLTRTADLGGIRNLLAQFNGKNVTITYDDDLGLHTVAGPLVYHPPSIMVGRSATTDVHVLSVTANGYGDFDDSRSGLTGNPSFMDYLNIGPGTMASKTSGRIDKLRKVVDSGSYSDDFEGQVLDLNTANMLVQIYDSLSPTNQAKFDSVPLDKLVDLAWKNSSFASKTAGQHQWQSDGVVGGHKTYCSFPGGHGPGEECPTDPREDGARMGQPSRAWRQDHPNQTANPQRTKVALIADAVQESNPGMDRRTALRIARKTLQRYPKVAASSKDFARGYSDAQNQNQQGRPPSTSCPACRGVGFSGPNDTECQACHGTGSVAKDQG